MSKSVQRVRLHVEPPTRRAERVSEDYTEVLPADAYGGYSGVVTGNAITRAGCSWRARKRRGRRLARLLDLIGQLFALEKQAKDVSVAERLALRHLQAQPMGGAECVHDRSV